MRGVLLFVFTCLLSPAAAQVAFVSGTLLQPSGEFINDAQMRSTNRTLIIDIEGASFLDNAITNALSRNALLSDLFVSNHPASDPGYESAWMAYFTTTITQAHFSLSRPLGALASPAHSRLSCFVRSVCTWPVLPMFHADVLQS